MNKKPPELPNIEDATLQACLAPLMEAMTSAGEPAARPSAPVPVGRAASQRAGSNDNPLPVENKIGSDDPEHAPIPKTLAEWRLQADDDFAAFRMVELFLAMTDVELAKAVAEFPRQITGTVERIWRIKQRLAAQYDRVTAAVALLERAKVQAAKDAGTD